jgi:hypothetical protein
VASALDILKRSMRMLGVYGIGETPSAEETADGMTAFNALLAEMSNTGLVYAKTLDTISVSANTSSITVGPSGTTATPRPVQVLDESYYTIGTVSHSLGLLTLQQYNDIGVKSLTGLPEALWVQPAMPDITITFYPVPSEAISLKLWSDKQLASTVSAATQLSFPPGYENCFAYLLAEAIAPEYQKQVTPDLMRGIQRSRMLLKRANVQIPKLSMPSEVGGSPSFVDIRQMGRL